jgi:Leucine-rich repeat (LRR) protein
VLNLYSNQLKSLPPQIGNLVNLNQLGLNENLLETLPNEIGNLTNLQILDLRYNRLEELPERISNLVLLKRLFLRYNRISQLPGMLGDINAPAVETETETDRERGRERERERERGLYLLNKLLYFVSRANDSLLAGIARMKDLQLLSVRNNLLESLPSDIGTLSKLLV